MTVSSPPATSWRLPPRTRAPRSLGPVGGRRRLQWYSPKVDHRDARTRAWLLTSILHLLPLGGFTHLGVLNLVIARLLLSWPLRAYKLLSLVSWVFHSPLLLSNPVVAEVALGNALLD